MHHNKLINGKLVEQYTGSKGYRKTHTHTHKYVRATISTTPLCNKCVISIHGHFYLQDQKIIFYMHIRSREISMKKTRLDQKSYYVIHNMCTQCRSYSDANPGPIYVCRRWLLLTEVTL